MSGPSSSSPDKTFQNRLNRVAERRAPYEASRPEVAVLPDWKSEVAAKLGIPLALFVGLLSIVLVRIGNFHVTGTAMVSDTPDMTLGIEFVGAMVLATVLFLALPYKGFQYKLFQFVGVALGALAMHNAVHAMPSAFSAAFSPDWTARVISETAPKSLYLRGEVIPLIPEKEEEAPKPIVRRLG